ncbi:lysophospholipid acyltransferase family protein [Anthocerotibacter panamensis]|uniref:lysophospholipid acyltransferase family protein n=1 Tax=Anthocerotibacter panamensis TaxID=2857077 RepID=UPI001C402784|nr:lysophospholipid acyltransferase family protein [Anthocerotibacter panamensis]
MSYPVAQQNLSVYNGFKWLVISPSLHLCFRLRIYGQSFIPTTPFIAVSNHASNLDPLLVANCIGRPTAFMAKEELFRVPGLNMLIRLFGAFPVKRGTADRAALRAASEALAAQWVVGLFIQGTRTADGRVTQPQPGAVLVAARTGVPLVPVSIWGSDRILPRGAILPRPARVAVRFGAPIAPPPSTRREDLDCVNAECARQINALLDLGY